MTIEILKELEKNPVLLLVIPPFKYHEYSTAILRQFTSQKICYVTLNKTYAALQEDFTREGINTKQMIFVDGISKTIKSVPDRQDNSCFYVSSPAALTEMSIAIMETVKLGATIVVFDSLNDLLVYEKKAPVSKFLLSIVTRLREQRLQVIFYTILVQEYSDLVKQTGVFVEKVIEL